MRKRSNDNNDNLPRVALVECDAPTILLTREEAGRDLATLATGAARLHREATISRDNVRTGLRNAAKLRAASEVLSAYRIGHDAEATGAVIARVEDMAQQDYRRAREAERMVAASFRAFLDMGGRIID
jgi:hypothetical protein